MKYYKRICALSLIVILIIIANAQETTVPDNKQHTLYLNVNDIGNQLSSVNNRFGPINSFGDSLFAKGLSDTITHAMIVTINGKMYKILLSQVD